VFLTKALVAASMLGSEAAEHLMVLVADSIGLAAADFAIHA
jgi:hypothetical protein